MSQPVDSASGWLDWLGRARAGPPFAVACILLLALVLFADRAWVAMDNPFFPGDSGHRMNHSDLPIVHLGRRVWLPFLELHIWLLKLLGLPFGYFKLVPACYFFAAIAALGAFAYRSLGRSALALCFSLLSMVCFSLQPLVQGLSVNLYQEMLGIALLYLLLLGGALEGRRSLLLWLVAAAALLTRDTFWIYLLVFTALNWRKILEQRVERRAFALLWAIPAGWLLSIPVVYIVVEGRVPSFPFEWPLMSSGQESAAPSSLANTLASLWQALDTNRFHLPLAGLVIASLVTGFRAAGVAGVGGSSAVDSSPLDQRDTRTSFMLFSLSSLAIIYGVFLLSNPWRPFGNPRMGAPLLPHLFVWAVLLLRRAQAQPLARRRLAAGLVVASLLLTVSPTAGPWQRESQSQARRVLADLRDRVEAASGGRGEKTTVCMQDEDYWGSVYRFIGPTLYAKREFLSGSIGELGNCDLVIAPTGNFRPGESFVDDGDVVLAGKRYSIFAQSRARSAR